MNPVEIEEAVSLLASAPFDRVEFAYQFLAAFGNKTTTIQRLRSGATNSSDIGGGVLQRSNIHIATCDQGAVDATLKALRESPKTATAKAKFILATDGEEFQAEEVGGEATVACAFHEVPDHFGFFLPLAGITTVEQIRESSFDIRATGRLNRLYIELLKDNPDWAHADRRVDMNHFMARLIFCFFAEDTDIFASEGLFTKTVEQMSARDSTDTHAIISEIFRAMDTKLSERDSAKVARYAKQFPYVNGQLFSGSIEVPEFKKMARSYLLHIGSLNWKKINPDIFGSMIQAVADDEERGSLGMHYTSVPNILKVLNPLFLDDLRSKLEEAGDNARKLHNLRSRIAKIRVFDPACGSGNFLVIAYKEMREIEAEINKRRGEIDRRTDIPLTNFRGIELRDFPAEIARLALIIAEFQCDILHRGQKEALAEFLPLNSENWITCANALRIDWLSVCPPTGTGVKVRGDDLFETPLDQSEIDFENEGGETYICGNPPYLGFTWQNDEQKADIETLFSDRVSKWKSLDYVAGWFLKASDYSRHTNADAAFVTTNSICQGEQVGILWSYLISQKCLIHFAHTSFKWTNLASYNAGVTVAIVGLTRGQREKVIYTEDDDGEVLARVCENISPYLVAGPNAIVEPISKPLSARPKMYWGNKPTDGGHLILDSADKALLEKTDPNAKKYIRPYFGSAEFIRGLSRYCVWVKDDEVEAAGEIMPLAVRFEAVRTFREESKAAETRPAAAYPYRFRQIQGVGKLNTVIVPAVSSERREYLPAGILPSRSVVSNSAFAMFDVPLFVISIITSKLHAVWVSTFCGKMKTDYRYSNTMGWNAFPLPTMTEQNTEDLMNSAANILIARESYFPATIADLYDPDRMDAEFSELRRAHEANDEVLERIYIGRRFRNDTERLEKLFELYTKMAS